jgi:predicted metal-dependent phosphoesterase TrpH
VIIDLHSHSTASDGQYPPTEVAKRAASAGLGVWALSDHDTVAGLAEAGRVADDLGVRFIAGIEISASLDRREIHVLGHFIDPTAPELLTLTETIAVRRRERMEAMVAQLAKLGASVSMPEVERFSGGKTLGRPHLARALVAKGLVGSVKEAFDRYLGYGRPGYAERFRLEAHDAIALIARAGGTASVAHPGSSRLERGHLARLAEMGMAGMEVDHADHNPSVRAKFMGIAQALDLVPTAGSDFHGEEVAPGRVLGSRSMSEGDFARLESRRAAIPRGA